jgi:regulator of protease activity HflC (stomatin/prohibitin superfamily)
MSWGVDVTRVELQAIEPPREIQQAMELQMRAERERRAAVTQAEAGKRAAILESEGVRESQIQRAEGEAQAAVLRAQGLAEARLAMAQAEAEALKRIGNSLPENQAAMYLLGIKYLEALPVLSQGKGTTIFLPTEATAVLGAVGGIKELLSRTGVHEGVEPGGARTGMPPVRRPPVDIAATSSEAALKALTGLSSSVVPPSDEER